MSYKILIADRFPVVRLGLSTMLARKAEEVLVSSNGSEAWSLVLTQKPDVLILGCNLTDLPAIQLVKQIRQHSLPLQILVYSIHGESDCLQRMLDVGVTGYLLMTESQDMVLQAVEAVSRGESWVSPCLLAKSFSYHPKNDPTPSPFTPREWTVLQGLLEGLSNSMIAAKYCLKEQVVKNYTTKIYRKMGVTTRTEAVLKAAKMGLLILSSSTL